MNRRAVAVLLILIALLGAGAGACALQAPSKTGTEVATPLQEVPGLENIQAKAYGSVTILEGSVAQEADRALAEAIAADQPGVSSVVNRVQVSLSLKDRFGTWREASISRFTRLLTAVPLLVLAALLVWITWLLGRYVARRYTRPRGPENKARNPFLVSLAGQAIRIGFVLTGLLAALQLLDAIALAGAVVGSAGVVGIALGFAFRDLAENYVASILLSVRQPFAPDDHVVVDGNEGIVVGLNSRATLLMTPDGNHLRLPNAAVFKAVILNYTRNGLRRFDFSLALSPETSADVALCDGLAELTAIEGVLADPAPFAQLQSADCEWLEVQYFGWCDQRRSNYGWLRSEAMRRVRLRLAKQGIVFMRPGVPIIRGTSISGPDGSRTTPASHSPEPAPGAAQVDEAVIQARAEMGSRDLLSTSAHKE